MGRIQSLTRVHSLHTDWGVAADGEAKAVSAPRDGDLQGDTCQLGEQPLGVIIPPTLPHSPWQCWQRWGRAVTDTPTGGMGVKGSARRSQGSLEHHKRRVCLAHTLLPALPSVRKALRSHWKGKPGSLALTLTSLSKSLKHFISCWRIQK